ncbi:MAG: LytR C-terminal domain-containing protein, partial [Solirubrobacteraceae bacterium]|nr:LytR C-terminal domain-containing protein [Solirubrobacteraceae bacterium]
AAAPTATPTPTPIPTPTPTPGVGGPGQAAPATPAAARAAAAQRSASLSAYANGSTGQDTRESPAARPEPLGSDGDGGISPGRIAAYVGGGLAVVLVGVVLMLVLTGGEETQQPNDFGNTPTQAAEGATGAAAGAGSQGGAGTASSTNTLTAAERRATQVAVLNGTTQTGLGRNVGDKIEKARFTLASVATNSDQQIPTTIVAYSAGNEAAARAVAKIVGVPANSVQVADANTAAAATADVVVTVGLDLTG